MNKEDFDISMSGSLEGIGATLKEDENYIKVVSIIAGSPASRQGQLQAEDIILKVGEGAGEPIDIIGMRVTDAVKLIRGKKGTEVRLTISKPDGKVLIIPIVRDIIQIEDTFVKGTTIKDEKTGDNFGYIRVPSFYRDFEKTRNGSGGRNSTDDVKAELTNFKSQNIKGLDHRPQEQRRRCSDRRGKNRGTVHQNRTCGPGEEQRRQDNHPCRQRSGYNLYRTCGNTGKQTQRLCL